MSGCSRSRRFPWPPEPEVVGSNPALLKNMSFSAIYKDRLQIEIFFLTVKQNLKIINFLGTSRNEILPQIWVTMNIGQL